MSKTSVDIDTEQLEQVRTILGTETIRETIATAFAEVIRVAAARQLLRSAEEGAFAHLLEPDVEERMWG